MKSVLAAAMLAIAAHAGASGDYGPSYTNFKAYRSPDIPLDRFQAGELGVLQPGMRRVYLYTAWRAISRGPEIGHAPGLQGGLARADGTAFDNGWSKSENEPHQDLVARVAAVLRLQANDPQARKILACPGPANTYAMRIFRTASARMDATPQRLDAWLLAQHQVGEACQEADDARYRFGNKKAQEIVAPSPLTEAEPLFWRQVRDYQRAAWQFHAQHYAESAALFERIGATPDHPMQELGSYLALRSEVRRAVAGTKGEDAARRHQQAQAFERRGEVILAAASLAHMHEPTRALLRSMRVALTPETRLEELNRYLDNTASDPFALDRLGDWSILMDGAKPQELRSRHDFIDWIETLRDCDRQTTCAGQAAHALERWQQTQSRPWLAAALMLAGSMPPAMSQAALAIAPDDPSYLTVRYHLARLVRLAGKPDEARTLTDAVLQRKLSPGTRNLFREERFAAAASVADAGAYLLRTNVDYAKVRPEEREDAINDDGLRWLNGGLSVADMIELAGVRALPQPVRARVAGAAWIRAALLDKSQLGRRAAAALAELVPAAADAAARYGRAGSAAERRHIVLVEALRFGLAAQLDMFAQPVERMAADDSTASIWCSFRAEQAAGEPVSFAWRLPAMPGTGETASRDEELSRLGSLKTATGVVGDDVLQWAGSHPDDSELPWLLHVVVMSTRGGCLDPDSKALSMKAFALLHKRYPGNDWARKTPYFY